MFPPIRLRSAFKLGGLTVPELARRSWKKIQENEIFTRAAAVAFYAMLALVPFLGLVLTLAVQALPDLTHLATGQEHNIADPTVNAFQKTLDDLVPPEASDLIESAIAELQSRPKVGLLSMGLVISVWLASSLFLAIIDALNQIHGVEESRPIWKLRLTAILMTFIQAVILVGSLVAIVGGPELMTWLGLDRISQNLVTIVQWLTVMVMILMSFALTFYVGPDADQRWEWITPGSLLGMVLFVLVSLGFRVYVMNFGNYDKTYGSLGGVMVILFWFWLVSVILLTADQINEVIEHASPVGKNEGQKIDPTSPPDLSEIEPVPSTPAHDHS